MFETLMTAGLGTGILLAIGLCGYKALYSDALGLDRGLAAIFFGAQQGETISYIVACWQRDGRIAGCRWCRLLEWVVETDHCAKQLVIGGPPTPLVAGLRAGVGLVLFTAALIAVPYVLGWVVLALWDLGSRLAF